MTTRARTGSLEIATDGACPGNPGPGGWAWAAENGESASGGEPAPSTNNRMELLAVAEALEAHAGTNITILTDSQLVVKSFTEWLSGWKERGMRKSDGKPVANHQLILRIDGLRRGRQVEFVHIRGHSGHALNERADRLATAAVARFADAPRADVDDGSFVCACCFLRRDRRQLSAATVCVDCR